jgi:hypothetical protein
MEEIYVIFNMEELTKVDFTKVMEDSAETVRISPDGTKALIAWTSEETPDFVSLIDNKEGPYTKEEVLPILRGDYWNKIIE